jgi:hypothetical protein
MHWGRRFFWRWVGKFKVQHCGHQLLIDERVGGSDSRMGKAYALGAPLLLDVCGGRTMSTVGSSSS